MRTKQINQREKLEHLLHFLKTFIRPSNQETLIQLKQDLAELFMIEISEEDFKNNSMKIINFILNTKKRVNDDYYVRKHDGMVMNSKNQPLPMINNYLDEFKEFIDNFKN